MGGTAPYTYLWSNGETSATNSSPSTGATITVTDANNCVAELTIAVEEDTDTPVILDNNEDYALHCNLTELTIVATIESSDPVATDWSTDDGSIVSFDSLTVTVNAAGTYLLTVVNTLNGCSTAQAYEVNAIPDPVIDNAILTHVSCFGEQDGMVMAEISGGLPPYTTTIDGGPLPLGLAAGDYLLEVSDANGCTVATDITIEEPEALSVMVDAIVAAMNGDANGEVSVTPNGGTPDYSYEWFFDNQLISTEEDLVDLLPGEYTLAVTDANGCTFTQMVLIDNITNTDELAADLAIRLFPNPATDRVQIELTLDESATVNWSIHSANGKESQAEQLVSAGRQQIEADLSTLSAGIYWVRVLVDDRVWVRKVVVL